jgi:hypothetical protein
MERILAALLLATATLAVASISVALHSRPALETYAPPPTAPQGAVTVSQVPPLQCPPFPQCVCDNNCQSADMAAVRATAARIKPTQLPQEVRRLIERDRSDTITGR